MSKTWLTRFFTIVLILVAWLGVDLAMAQNDVTFRVNMSIKMREGTFLPGSGDIVRVAGSFNDWGNSLDTLRDVATVDSIYEKTISLPAGSVEYKFLKTLRGGLDWEGGSNRTYTVVSGAQTVPLVWFDNDSVFTPAAPVSVTFHVNMRVKILEGTFQPGSGDIVRVAGSFNDWGNSLDTLRDLSPIDSIYSKTVTLLEQQAVQYKFLKTPRGGLDWEGFPDNRQYTVAAGGGELPVVFFDNDSVINAPFSGTILWNVDMSAYQEIGWFNPALDDMEVRGGFQGWTGGTTMTLDPFSTATYERAEPYTGTTGDMLNYKYYMALDSATAVQRFPGWASNQDGMNYEHPAERGDGNRLFEVQGSGNIGSPVYWFSSINPKGLLLNETDSVTVTLRVNMGPAKRSAVPFNPAADTVQLLWEDALWRAAQARRQGAFPQILNMSSAPGGGDSVYQVSFLVVGKAHYNMQYRYRYTDGSRTETEGGGLGAQNPYRSRFIVPTAPNTFSRSFTASLEEWKKSPPLPADTPPFDILNDVFQDPAGGLPGEYKLTQNYPNPFNPSTFIRYSIPVAGQVTLKVFNILGQEVASLVNEHQQPGNYVAQFEASRFASGVYFYRLEAGKFKETKKMVLLK